MAIGQSSTLAGPGGTLGSRTLGLLAALSAVGTLSTTIILPSFPSMARDLGVPMRAMGGTLSSFLIAFAVGQLFVGPLSDRFGRRPFITGGLAIFLIGSLICAVAGSLDMLILGRVIQALGACAASVMSRAVARDLFEGEALTRVLSLIMIAMAAAPGFSPLLGTGLEAILGWRSIFLVVGATDALLLFGYLVGLGGSHSQDRRAALSLVTVARGYAGLLTNLVFIAPSVAIGMLVGSLYAFFGISPAILLETLRLLPVHLGLFYAATVFVVFGAGMAAPRLVRRLGARAAVLGGLMVAALGGALVLLPTFSPAFWAFAPAIVVFLGGFGVANPVLTSTALQPFGRQAGLASALLGFIQMGGAALATWMGTQLPLSPFVSLATLLLFGTLTAMAMFGLGHRQLRVP